MSSTELQQTSGFFQLPGELRNTIYRLVLVHKRRKRDVIDIRPLIIRKYSSLLHVSQQIRSEASSIFYGENTFRAATSLYDSMRLLPWLRAIGWEQARLISSLEVTLVSSQAMMRVVEGLFPVRCALWGPVSEEMVHQVDHAIIDEPARALAAVVLFKGVRADVVQVTASTAGDDDAQASGFPDDDSVFFSRAARAFQERLGEGAWP